MGSLAGVIVSGLISVKQRTEAHHTRHPSAFRETLHDINAVSLAKYVLLDNFEWSSGYLQRFGPVCVNYASQRCPPRLPHGGMRISSKERGVQVASTAKLPVDGLAAKGEPALVALR